MSSTIDQSGLKPNCRHADPNKVRAAYNHAEYVEQRRTMMQEWADRLDQWELEGQQDNLEPAAPLAMTLSAANQAECCGTAPQPVVATPDRSKQDGEVSPVAPVLTIISAVSLGAKGPRRR